MVVGKAGVGKSQLISSLTQKEVEIDNLKGSTVCGESHSREFTFVDTSKIVFDSDNKVTKTTISSIKKSDYVLLVARATNLDEDLKYPLSLLKDKKGAIIITNWDRVHDSENVATALIHLEQNLRMPITAIDARNITESQRGKIFETLRNPHTFSKKTLYTKISFNPKPTILESGHVGIVIGVLLLLFPSILSVIGANYFAGFVHPIIEDLLSGTVNELRTLPSPLMGILAGDYGFVTMGPFLFVWAAPVVVIYALLLGIYKSTGLLDRTSLAIHPLVKRIGVSGKDVTKIVMGFGCNVPAVIGSRSCSDCSRGTVVSTISLGSACSYQFGASIAVFAAAGMPWLVVPFLFYLTITTIIYTRLVSTKNNRSKLNMPVIEGQTFFEKPTLGPIWRESKQDMLQFFKTALPIFFAITFAASMLNWAGVVDFFADGLGAIMGLFNLPEDAALAVIAGSIRKDGLLLLAGPHLASSLSAMQILTGVYLAGTLLPCLVTFMTIIREMSWRFALKMVTKQVVAVIAFTLFLAHAEKVLHLFGI